jgi:predicted DNA-binding protein (UPF0251 family)
MVRPCNNKNIENDPEFTCFKPLWIPRNQLEKIEVSAEEFEALRLSNLEWLSNQSWAEKMNTSAPTFNRLVKSAQTKITNALVNWKWIRIYKKDWTHNCK